MIVSEKKIIVRSSMKNITNAINGERNLVKARIIRGNRQNQNDYHDHANNALEIILMVIDDKMCCMKA